MNEIDTALERATGALEEGRGLEGTGFWRAVRKVRADHNLAETYAARIARIDRRAFELGVRARVSIRLGTLMLDAGIVTGLVLLAVAALTEDLLQTLAFLAGFGALLVFTHCRAHIVVGRLLGIRFTHVFLGGPPPPKPGAKTDYVTYLNTPPRARAVMHASGAVVTKLVPFVLIPYALSVEVWVGVVWILVFVGVVGIVTDVFLSTKVSDWKKVKRELGYTRGW